MKAVILCAGYGKRMQPYTSTYQKVMLPIHGKPLLEYIITGLIHGNMRDIIIVVGYRKEQIINYFKDGSQWNVHIEYVEQKELNGTGGALLLCEKLLKNKHFCLVWGDILVPYIIYKMVHDVYLKEQHDFIIVSNYKEDLSKGGAIYCDGDYCLEIVEKEPKTTRNTALNNCGIFIFSREIFEVLKQVKPSKRGEIEIPATINKGIKDRNWNVFVIKLDKHVFRADFGDKKVYEELQNNPNWLKKLDF